MRTDEIREMCIESCRETYEYMGLMQLVDPAAGKAAVDVRKAVNHGAFYTLYLSRRIADADGLSLIAGGREYGGADLEFAQLDARSMTVVLYPSDRVRRAIDSAPEGGLKLAADLRWLIKRAEQYYADYGGLIGYPESAPDVRPEDAVFPEGSEPTAEQRAAVAAALGSKLSYIWGAPGTGKTQLVLATAVLAYLREGRRVAVVAPTNNSLEQVLRGVLGVVAADGAVGVDLRRDVLRLGAATSDFMAEFPYVCEMRDVGREVGRKLETMRVMQDALSDRALEMLKPGFDEIRVLINEEYGRADYAARKRIMGQVRRYLDEMRYVVGSDRRLAGVLDGVDEYSIGPRSDGIARALYGRDRTAAAVEDYSRMTAEELRAEIDRTAAEAEALCAAEPAVKAGTAKLLAMTPQVLMGRFAPRGAGGGGPRLDVDHIFVDEVGYCNVINVLPLLCNRVPVTMLGDHKQLPPVCQIDDGVIRSGILEGNEMRYSFMWDQPALFAEGYLSGTAEGMQRAYLEGAPPPFGETAEADLTASHRFGDNLARILDECVYRNGISGVPGSPLEIVCVDAVCAEKATRANPAEAEAVRALMEEMDPEPGTVAVLTPYADQARLLASALPKWRDDVMTVHRAQGREWDTVVFSVANCRAEIGGKDVQLRFTSTADPDGIGTKVVNTAVSRARRRLVLVCDRGFWTGMPGELVGRLAGCAP